MRGADLVGRRAAARPGPALRCRTGSRAPRPPRRPPPVPTTAGSPCRRSRRPAGSGRPRCSGPRPRASGRTLAAGVHHPGFLEHGHELRGTGQGRFAFLEQPPHELADVPVSARRPLRGRGGSRATVRIVPSRGSSSDSYSRSAPGRMARGHVARCWPSGGRRAPRRSRAGSARASCPSCHARRARRRGPWCGLFPEVARRRGPGGHRRHRHQLQPSLRAVADALRALGDAPLPETARAMSRAAVLGGEATRA